MDEQPTYERIWKSHHEKSLAALSTSKQKRQDEQQTDGKRNSNHERSSSALSAMPKYRGNT